MKDFVQTLSEPRVAARVGFVWGFAEGLFFFLVPDVYILFVTLFSRRSGWRAFMWSIAGSLVSVLAMYIIVVVLGLPIRDFFLILPGIKASLHEAMATTIAASGLPFTPLLALGGVPLKLYTSIAFGVGYGLPFVLMWTIFARLVRIGPGYVVVCALRASAYKKIDAHPNAWIVVYVVVWIVFYAYYFSKMGW